MVKQKRKVQDAPGTILAARHSKRTGREAKASRPVQFSYARRHDSDGNPLGDPLADFAGPPAEDCHGAEPTLFPALHPLSVSA